MKFRPIDLTKYHKKTPFLSILPVPKKLVMIRGLRLKPGL